MCDSSPIPDMDENLTGMLNDIISESGSDFSPDDEYADPTFNLRTFYENAGEQLNISDTPTGSLLSAHRSLPLNYSSSSYSESPVVTPTRKRKKCPKLWKQNIRKRLREHGEEYIDRKGAQKPARKIGPTCGPTCFYQCTKFIADEERNDLHKSFWKLSVNEKNTFYGTFIKQIDIKRRRTTTKDTINHRKRNSFHYYLKVQSGNIQVCKKYFLNTFGITDRIIYYYFNVLLNKENGLLQAPKHHGRSKTPENKIQEIKDHILSFPTIDSHYCRANTSRKYLESHLSVQKMYLLYQEKYPEPLSLNIYRNVFNNSFNLAFFVPRKDQCDKCSLFKVNKDRYNDVEKKDYENHIEEKQYAKAELDRDRQNIDNCVAILCYDLQNVFTLPKVFASNFFYRRKLNVFNLTGILIKSSGYKITYCSIWNESCGGRSGNDNASALIKILNWISHDHPEISKLILWSDSCVPQNRNQFTATALLYFLSNNPSIKQILQKYSEPGHSTIQEVDCVHSTIEKHLRKLEIASQISLIRILRSINYENVKLQILQMMPSDFKSYSQKAGLLYFQHIPFTKIKYLQFENRNLIQIGYSTSFKNFNIQFKCINKQKHGRYTKNTPKDIFKQTLNILPKKKLDLNKVKDLQHMISYLESEDDRRFYRAVIS